MADLVPVRSSGRAPALRGRPWLRPQTDPFREFEDLWERMASRFLGESVRTEWPDMWTPLVDVEETDDAWLFELDLPGTRREDIQIDAGDQELTISGEIKERERSGVVRQRTRRTGRFSYQTTLPAGVDADQIDARFDNGVLTVRVPRPEQTKPHRIKID